MKRYHLFEFEDFKWFPDIIRDGGTDYLGFILKTLNYYKPVVPLLEEAIKKTAVRQVVDLCSGSGGSVELLCNSFDQDLYIKFLLTDKFPNLAAFEDLKERSNNKIDFRPDSVDVLNFPADLQGFRTMFSAIHHFRPEEVESIIKQSIKCKMPIGIFDSADKHPGTIIGFLFHPIIFFFCTPFIKPFKFSRIFFTYLISLIPIYTIWDGIVSILRLYHPKELLVIAKAADVNAQYTWESGKVKNKFGFKISYLIGVPN